MAISSSYLVGYVCATIIIYLLIPQKKAVILFASILFLGVTSFLSLIVLLLIALIAFKTQTLNSIYLKCISIGLIVSLLLVVRFNEIFNLTNALFFVGLSFYGLQAIAFITQCKPNQSSRISYIDLCVYLGNFFTIISGPIHEPNYFLSQLSSLSNPTIATFIKGIKTCIVGFTLKLVISNNIYLFFLSDLHTDNVSNADLIPLLFIQSFYVFFDFYSYSIIVIGIGLLFNVRIMENFNDPYGQISFKNLWKHWHISFSNWLFKYVYIPLGGKKLKIFGLNIAALLTFLVSGIWHGLSLNFIIWGLLHFALFSISSFYKKVKSPVLLKIVSWPFYMLIISITWHIFLNKDLEFVLSTLTKLFFIETYSGILYSSYFFIVIMCIFFYFLSVRILKLWTENKFLEIRFGRVVDYGLFTIFLFMLSIFGGFESRGFLYFNF